MRLVKGAYWDHEIVEARQHGWSPPVFEVKADSDRNFELLTRRLLEAAPGTARGDRLAQRALGGPRDRGDRALGGGPADLELQVLRGLGDDLQRALVADGHRVRTYCPVGDLVAGMAYLVRRLLENTSNDRVPRRTGRRHPARASCWPRHELRAVRQRAAARAAPRGRTATRCCGAVRARPRAAAERTAAGSAASAATGEALVSTDPGTPERVVALAPLASAEDAARASPPLRAVAAWSRTPAASAPRRSRAPRAAP